MIEIYSKDGCYNCVEVIKFISTLDEESIIYKLGQHFKKDEFSSSCINCYPIIRWEGVLYSYGSFMKCYKKI